MSRHQGLISGVWIRWEINQRGTKKGTKFLIISHDIEFIAKTCDRLVKLENGIITEDFYIDNIGQLLIAMEAK